MEFKKCSIGGTLYQEAGSKDELPLGCKVTPQHPYHPLPTCTNLHQPLTTPYQLLPPSYYPLSPSHRPLTTSRLQGYRVLGGDPNPNPYPYPYPNPNQAIEC